MFQYKVRTIICPFCKEEFGISMEFEFLEFYECTSCGRTLNGKNPGKILNKYKMTCSDCPKIVFHGDDGYCSKYNGLLIENPLAVTVCTEVN